MSYEELREIPVTRERAFSGILINVDHMRVRLPDGGTARREIVVHVGAAAVVPVDEYGYVTLVRQHRVALDMITLEIPAGKLDSIDEEPLVCARRELLEETGLRAGSMVFLTGMITTPGFCTEQVRLYLATELTQHESRPDPDEYLGVVRMPLSEAVARVMSGELSDAKTALGLLMADRYLQQT